MIVICLPAEHLQVHRNSLKCVHVFQIKLEFGSVVLFQERGKAEYPEKNLSEQGREPTNKLNPHSYIMASMPGFEPGHIRGKCFHHCPTLAPTCIIQGSSSPFFTIAIHTKHIQHYFMRTSEVQVQFICTLNKILHKEQYVCCQK